MRIFTRWQVLQALSHAVVKLLLLKRKREMKDLWQVELKCVITSIVATSSTTVTTTADVIIIVIIIIIIIIITMGTEYLSREKSGRG